MLCRWWRPAGSWSALLRASLTVTVLVVLYFTPHRGSLEAPRPCAWWSGC